MYNKKNHPCFNIEAKNKYARVHLPVAPKCNIQCKYCNRKYDCVNESRPGVTSSVLNPYQAVAYLEELTSRLKNISVIGIAGPGDPFANPEATTTTMRLIKEKFPGKIFCLSTNGLNLQPYIEEISGLGVSHVTITINAVDVAIAEKIYSWIRIKNQVYYSRKGAELLLKKQLACIPILKEKGITVKINTVIIPGVNDQHISTIARKVKEQGADIMNCIPLIPTEGTEFKDFAKPSGQMMAKMRQNVKKFLPVMTHCSHCRADAAGLLGQDLKNAFRLVQEFASKDIKSDKENRCYVAVASSDGLLVNAHLGRSDSLLIYKQTHNGFRFVERRATPAVGAGDFRWITLSNTLKDCRALLVKDIGPNPVNILKNSGIRILKMAGLIDEGLDAVYNRAGIELIENCESSGNCNAYSDFQGYA
jgi:nitrogen fixation protein NifB